jgi:hypothetical protein
MPLALTFGTLVRFLHAAGRIGIENESYVSFHPTA